MKDLRDFVLESLNEDEKTIKSEKDFREAARAKFEEVFGDDLDEDKMNKTIDGLLEDNKDLVEKGEWGELIGMLNKSFAPDDTNENNGDLKNNVNEANLPELDCDAIAQLISDGAYYDMTEDELEDYLEDTEELDGYDSKEVFTAIQNLRKCVNLSEKPVRLCRSLDDCREMDSSKPAYKDFKANSNNNLYIFNPDDGDTVYAIEWKDRTLDAWVRSIYLYCKHSINFISIPVF